MILNLEGYRDSDPTLEVIFDGWPNAPVESARFSRGVWHSVQVEVRYGNASTAFIKVWIDTDTYGSPGILLSGHAASDPGNGNTHFGAFTNDGLQADGVFIHRHADFRVATTFDARWHASLTGGVPPPGPPSNVLVTR
jgi:hypothetical protein